MIRRGGIDSQIEQRKMQFEDNPQALQQRYGQSKQLLDLLALQQIAEEQKQKSQMMQMQMQQNPATIAEQVEQEALQGKKAEMAQSLQGMQAMRAPKRSQSETARGVAGALAQKQREQQSRMQRMAGSGVAGQRARNMERMYNGGIVGFDNGGAVTDEEIDAAIRENPRLANLPRESVRNIVAKQIARRSAERESVEGLRERAAADPRVRRYTRPQPEQVQEERREPKPFSERGVTLEPEETRVELPGADLPEGLMPASMQRQIEGRRSLDATLEDPEFQALLEEAAGGFAPDTPARVGDDRQTLIDDITSITSGEARPPTPSAPARPEAGGLPENVLGALESSMQRGAAPAAPATPAAAQGEDRLRGIYSALEGSMKQEAEDIQRARDALEAQYGGRTKGKRFLDRLIAASQTLGSGRPATSNRQALSRLLGGYAGAAGAEREAEKKGLEAIAERQRQLTQGRLGVATGLAQIERGEAMTQLERDRLAQQERQFDVTMGQRDDHFSRGLAQKVALMEQQGRQFDRNLVLQGKQLAARVLKDADQTRYQRESLQIQRELNAIREEAGRANTKAERNRVATELRKNNTAQERILREEKDAALQALLLDPSYVEADATTKDEMRRGIAEAYNTTIEGYRLDTDQLIKDLTGIEVPRTASSAPTTGEATNPEVQRLVDKYK